MREIGLLLFLTACSSSSSPTDGGASDTGSSQDVMTAQDSGGGNDSGSGMYCPAGASMVPYLSASRTTMFGMPQMVLQQGKDYLAVLETDVGRIVLDLYEAETPMTVNSFVFLALNHFYDGVAFHRVIADFVAQGGDPNTVDKPSGQWGTGGPGYMYTTELKPNLNFDARGVLGMARSMSMSSNGSQFFITFKAQPGLSQQYTVFGKLTEGDAVLDLIKKGDANVMNGLVSMNPTRMTTVHICAK